MAVVMTFYHDDCSDAFFLLNPFFGFSKRLDEAGSLFGYLQARDVQTGIMINMRYPVFHGRE